MNCKNCNYSITNTAKFCSDCGAKIIDYRLSVRKIKNDFLSEYLGWDNKYFKTFFTFTTSPGKIVGEFISGVRKKYLSPFTFLAIGLTMSTLVFSLFAKEYSELMVSMQGGDSYYTTLFDMGYPIKKTDKEFDKKEYGEKLEKYIIEQRAFTKKSSTIILKYFNVFAFITIPLYTLVAFLTFGRKKYNYREHLVINCYIQGFSMMVTTFIFLLSIMMSPSLFYLLYVPLVFYYLLTYKQLLGFSWANAIVKFFKFVLITIGLFLSLIITSAIIGLIIAFIFK